MKRLLIVLSLLLFLQFCQSKEQNQNPLIQTVSGEIDPDALGTTLIHEHILVDFIGADSTGFHRWDKNEVVSFILPFLKDAMDKGIRTMVECTPSYLGKDPELLKLLSEKTGMHFLTNVGYYGALSGKYLPQHAFEETAEQLAERWIKEVFNGIEETGVKPGFIKISVNEGPILSEIDAKLVKAAAITNLETGLLIVSHTGSWETARAQVDLLKLNQASPENFVWVHAQNEKNFENYRIASQEGVWISLDGIVWDVEGHLERLVFIRDHIGLEKVLISHDAGWYSPGEQDQGSFKGYTSLFDNLVPLLFENDFTQADIDKLLIENPKKAFSITRQE
jgi:phosphotriesterase-related protein